LPSPDDANAVQWKVTELQVAVAVTVCACALAVNIANDRTTSGTIIRTRGTIAAPRPTPIAAGVELRVFMRELLRAGVLSLWPAAEISATSATAVATRSWSAEVAELGAAGAPLART
jgi:hypothetical protein